MEQNTLPAIKAQKKFHPKLQFPAREILQNTNHNSVFRFRQKVWNWNFIYEQEKRAELLSRVVKSFSIWLLPLGRIISPLYIIDISRVVLGYQCSWNVTRIHMPLWVVAVVRSLDSECGREIIAKWRPNLWFDFRAEASKNPYLYPSRDQHPWKRWIWDLQVLLEYKGTATCTDFRQTPRDWSRLFWNPSEQNNFCLHSAGSSPCLIPKCFSSCCPQIVEFFNVQCKSFSIAETGNVFGDNFELFRSSK